MNELVNEWVIRSEMRDQTAAAFSKAHASMYLLWASVRNVKLLGQAPAIWSYDRLTDN